MLKGLSQGGGNDAGTLAVDLESLWQSGSLHFATSAPRNRFGRCRATVEPNVPNYFAGQVTCIVLPWVGNKFFHHEALRRAMGKPMPLGPILSILRPRTPALNAMN
ncbi:MAG: hypothetical protein ACKPKO_02450, partial [Candidatus Fonsibacter sp.]